MTYRSVILMMVFVAACSHSENGVDSTQQADTPTDAQCTSALLVDGNADASVRVCQGPWRFSQWQQTPSQDPSCGIDHYPPTQCAKTCQSPNFGAADWNATGSTSGTIRGTREAQCAGANRGITTNACTKHYYCDNYPTDCDTLGAQLFQSYMLRVDSRYRDHASYSVSQTVNTTSCVITCSVSITGLPDYNWGTDANSCGTYTCDDTAHPVYKTCINSNSPYTTGPVATVSATNLSLSQLKAAWHPDTDLAMTCTTGDDMPLEDANPQTKQANVQAFDNRLTDTLTWLVGAPNPALRAAVVSKLKLLYELDAAMLTADQINAIVALYDTDRGGATECGTAGSGPSLPASCGDTSSLQETYRICTQLALPHVGAGAVAPFFNRCLGLFQSIDALPADPACQHDTLKPAAHTLVNQLLGKLMTITDAGKPATALTQLDAWYRAVSAAFYASGSRDGLWLEVDHALAQFWSTLEAPIFAAADAVAKAPGTATPATLEAQLDGASSQMMVVDRAVLLAAFPDSTTPPPLTSAPLLYLVGDALHDLRQRLEQVSPLQDLGCRFGGTCAPSRKTEVSELWGALAQLQDADALGTALGKAPDVRDWKTVLTHLQAQHAALETAANDAAGVSSGGAALLRTGAVATLPTPMRALASVVQSAADHDATFTSTGLFDGTLRGYIDQGIQDTAVANFIGTSQKLEQQFASQLGSFESNLQTLAGNVLAVAKQSGEISSIDDKLQTLGTQRAQLVSDMFGMRAAAEGAVAKLGNFGQSFQQFLDSNAADPNYTIVRNTTNQPPSFGVQASDARYLAQLGGADLAISIFSPGGTPWKMSAKKGELLNVGVNGTWEPTCALQKANFGGYTMQAVTRGGDYVDLSAAQTGPEGYTYNVQTGSMQVTGYSTANTESDFQDNKLSYQGCAGLGWSYIVIATSQFCGSTDWGHASTQSTTFDNSSHSSVNSAESFTSGLRLADTPFPELPAGALVLVEVPAGSASLYKSNVYRTHVLQPQRSIVFDKDVDLYLVVNDKHDDTCNVGGGLTVTMSHVVPQGALVKALGDAMGTTLTNLEQTFSTYLAQGHVTAAEISAFEADAQTQLASTCGCDPSTFQPSLLGFYNAWVAEEAAQLQRLGELIENERAQQLLDLQIKELIDQKANAQQQLRLSALLPAWTLRNLASENLQAQTQAMVRFVNQHIWPVAHLRYAQTFAQIANAPGAQAALNQLATAQFDSSFVQLAHYADQAVYAINQQFDLNGPAHHLSYPRVALRFPRPGLDKLTAGTQVSGMKAVDPLRARAVWDAIAANQPAPFRVTIEDLYDKLGGASLLTCRDAVPAIHSASLVVVFDRTQTGADQYTGEGWRLPLFLDETMTYPGAAGPETYQIGPDLQNFGIRVLFANEDKFTSVYDGIEALPNEVATLKIAEGLSPFTIFQVNLSKMTAAADQPLAKASELMLVFDLETQDASLTTAIDVCK